MKQNLLLLRPEFFISLSHHFELFGRQYLIDSKYLVRSGHGFFLCVSESNFIQHTIGMSAHLYILTLPREANQKEKGMINPSPTEPQSSGSL